MKVLRQLAIVLGFLLMGEGIRTMLGIAIPGTVTGMILLFLALMLKVVRIEQVETVSKLLLDHLAFLFVPAGVGLISCMEVIGASWLHILVIIVVSTGIVMGTTGLTVQLMKRRRT
jgi:holin-like protein